MHATCITSCFQSNVSSQEIVGIWSSFVLMDINHIQAAGLEFNLCSCHHPNLLHITDTASTASVIASDKFHPKFALWNASMLLNYH
jgi:hypothetical protein